MSDYTPDKWVGVKISSDKHPSIYKIFASWYGGWAGSDSWKLNSGITKVTEDGSCYLFDGYSGSTYICRKGDYGTNGYSGGILQNLIERAALNGITMEMLPEETNWLELNYE
jgi:hypothetical protein